MAMRVFEEGREAYARRAWRQAYEALAHADEAEPLAGGDLELMAVSAYMLGRDDVTRDVLERAHQAHLRADDTRAAIRTAFWIGMTLVVRGETGPGGGWLARAQRLVDQQADESAERGYLLLPQAFRHEAAGDWETGAATAARAAEIAVRFADDDLFALAAHLQGHFLVAHGRVEEGARLLDEAMIAATSPTAFPIVTGVVYCGVILACVEAYDVRRAHEWTDVLSRWCEEQPELVAFRGRCLVHRAEIMQLRGAWAEALEEARQAEERLTTGFNRPATAQAFYRQGELHRLRGEHAAADAAYRAANRYGLEPQPGRALLLLARGQADTAAKALQRLLAEIAEPGPRARLLPAYVDVALALGDAEAARAACGELAEIAGQFGSALLAATAAHCLGGIRLADGDPAGALAALREAARGWEELEAPYERAWTRVLLGRACRALGDEDGAALELEAARETFAELGAAPDVAHVDELTGRDTRAVHGLTARELEVLRLVAAGRSNREIAAALVISDHTVARHLQNIFRKLDVSSRTAAGAFAHEHGLA